MRDPLADALKRAAVDAGRLAVPPDVSHVARLGGRRRRRRLAVVAACAVCVLGAGAALGGLALGSGAEPVRPAAPTGAPSGSPSGSSPESPSLSPSAPPLMTPTGGIGSQGQVGPGSPSPTLSGPETGTGPAVGPSGSALSGSAAYPPSDPVTSFPPDVTATPGGAADRMSASVSPRPSARLSTPPAG
ncbi:hypothetical protein ACWCQL_28490 [Streptomyces sp. NPDC002073]|uniref:hypothetical protein n=1 Tax=Streptomyces sp. NBC_00239 TaxID=2903640 RepID=UPI002E2E0BE5|nr:hypothetical protein [Streptomyces sp. NBC_00239]